MIFNLFDAFENFTDFLTMCLTKENINYLIRSGSILLLNMTSYFYVFLKFYRVLCYSRMTFDWLPMINPYIWPFSIFHLLTGPYFSFWSKILPSIKIERSSIEISAIVALEVLNSLTYFSVQFCNFLVFVLRIV